MSRWRPFPSFSWDLRACGRHGHTTYAPDESDLRARLSAPTPAGESWRCLRCGDFVPGPPRGRGPAADAPVVLRGRALRDAFVLRLLAVERAVRGVLLVLLAYGLHRFAGAQGSLQKVFAEDLPLLKPLADKLGVDLQNSGPVRLINEALGLSHGALFWLTLGVLAYGALELLEAVGLWLMRRWGEYVATVGTAIFLPLEIRELVERVTLLRLSAFAINVAAVAYLLYTKRLFGLRGGRAAFEAERHSESLLEVERAAVATEVPARQQGQQAD
jgi:uncharacterized membrane protein (DUF2068 family)